MLIRDLEFINSTDINSSDSALQGGASADTYAVVYTDNNNVYTEAGASAYGDSTRASTGTGAKLFSNKYYTAGYGFAKGIATGRDGRDYNYSVSYVTEVI